MFQKLTIEMYFKPTHVYHPLWELRAWYMGLWPLARGLVVVSMVPVVAIAVWWATSMPDLHQDDGLIEQNRMIASDDYYENYTPNEVELEAMLEGHKDVVTPSKYANYVSRTSSQTNRYRRLKKTINKHVVGHKKVKRHDTTKRTGTTD
jgi:hypothetical protein